MPHLGSSSVNSFVPRQWLTSFWEGHLVAFMVWMLLCGNWECNRKRFFWVGHYLGVFVSDLDSAQGGSSEEPWAACVECPWRHIITFPGGFTDVYLVRLAATLNSFGNMCTVRMFFPSPAAIRAEFLYLPVPVRV